jgi:PAS domain S-box-containing protein
MPAHPLTEALGNLLEAAPVGAALFDAPAVLVWANGNFFTETHFPPSLLGQDLSDHASFRDRPFLGAVRQALQDRASSFLQDVPGPSPTAAGSSSGPHLDVWTWPVQGEGKDHPQALVLVSSSELRVQEHQRARLFYESFLTSSNPMEVTDQSGILVDVNPAFERVYGYKRAECIGRKPNLVRSRRTDPRVYDGMWKDLKDPALGHWAGEIVNRDRRGRDHPVFLTITAVKDDAGQTTHYVGVAVDLTERRMWEEGAARADRLASVGQLAAGVAHEINTPLANITLIAESIKRRAQDPWLSQRADSISNQVEVAAKIVRGLLDFSRRGEPHLTDLDLGTVVRDSVEFVQGKQTPEVELEVHVPPSPLPISGDRGQLMQVLANLLNNAYDAVEGRGRIIIRARADEAFGEVEVADSGPGIPPDVLARIFEPFFTTKEEGRGTGLGLAICQGIVAAHQGTISVQNLLGSGASFVVRLPLRKTGGPPAVRAATTREPASAARERARTANPPKSPGAEERNAKG